MWEEQYLTSQQAMEWTLKSAGRPVKRRIHLAVQNNCSEDHYRESDI
ncbi:mCG1049938 [Mus musculus]|nr:mCG1049938 [Mus musculus]